MKLVVPFLEQLKPIDERLIRLADFLGVEAVKVPLTKASGSWIKQVEMQIPREEICLAFSPGAFREWPGCSEFPVEFACHLTERFRHLLVYGIGFTDFDASVVTTLSEGALGNPQTVPTAETNYEISMDAPDICLAFTGLVFGPVNPVNDRVFSRDKNKPALRQLISVAGLPLMAVAEKRDCKIWFFAGESIADLGEQVGDAPVSKYFSKLLPYAMAIRSIFGKTCWHPVSHYASVIIDDPLLQHEYGFLNYDLLLEMLQRNNFHSTIAFIPHNFKRSSVKIARMFREQSGRLSLCFHGNDHTRAEFASPDTALLNTLLQIAEQRMETHAQSTGIKCDRVMVFPQGHFSVEAMSTLKAHNFDAAVNTTPHPKESRIDLTLRELIQPAVLRYGDFPLFLRKNSAQTQEPNIALYCFFGKPVLIVEHHDIFQNPEPLTHAVKRINTVAPGIIWSNLGTVVRNSVLQRNSDDGTMHILAFAGTTQIVNHSNDVRRFQIEWKWSGSQNIICENVLQDGAPFNGFVIDPAGVCVSVDLPAGATRTYSLVHRNAYANLGPRGFRNDARAFLRRRLSEARDNYLSKRPGVLKAAKTLKGLLPV